MKLNEALQPISEASEFRDRALRGEAERVHRELVNAIRQYGISAFYNTTFNNGVLLDLGQIAKQDIKLILQDSGPSGALTKVKNKNIPVLIVGGFNGITDMDLREDKTDQFVASVLIGQKATFIHEFIHTLDSYRTNDFFGRPSISDSDEEYFNHPSELNAFYQEGIQSLEDRILKFKERGMAWRFANQSFEETFDNFVKIHLHDEFWNNLTNENKRRIRKRFYNFYSETMPDLLSGEEQ